jgi:adenine phosphoribosyltransferase
MNLNDFIRDIPDFPKPGILFKDLMPLFANYDALKEAAGLIAAASGNGITRVAGIESRGFIVGTAVALELGVGFSAIRKPGKLPGDIIREEYTLEYGTDALEMHRDALNSNDRILLVDDLLATGGTMAAAATLVEKTGASVGKIACIVELAFLEGRKKLSGYDVQSLIVY